MGESKRIAGLVLAFLCLCSVGWTEPDYNALADAIRRAEGNSNYGILTHYKHTSYRQACINTCKHAWRDYLALVGKAPQIKGKGHRNDYLAFLANRYCPIGADNDPTGLNVNWLGNVSAFYKGDV